jgi:DNA-binding NarL/FixJ family response regulator
MSYTVLVVDDFEPWRRHVASTLGESSRWRIVGEAADGPDAIEKAADLRPDLILLDVGLPTLNGIEAARRILAHDPNLRILFVSEHQSWEIAETALATGARGYICKSDSGRQLSPAMDAIIDERRFVAERFGGRGVEQTGRHSSPNGRRHEALYYSNDAQLLDQWTSVAEAALRDDATYFVLATDPRRDRLEAMLRARGVDMARAIRDGRYVSVSVDKALSNFMVGNRLDETRFWETVNPWMLRMANASTAEHPRVVACGECAPALCAQGNGEAAVRLEQLWDEVTRTYHLDTFCGYSSGGCHCEDPDEVIEKVRAAHTATYSR